MSEHILVERSGAVVITVTVVMELRAVVEQDAGRAPRQEVRKRGKEVKG